ncbi:MAG: cobalamin-independent methionine synthase II family protein [Planctomycetes bacterium]|nr:cobalamin-independent methionine synthase II family protein [Planctomycetota bacterium]
MTPTSPRTTVVGSYPVPDWLKSHPNEETLRDALTVVIRAQESAGIEVVSDGELGRWDPARDAAGGMVERFVRPMAGVECVLTRAQLEAFQSRASTSYRKHPPGVVTGPLGDGTLNLRRDWELARGLAARPMKFTVTSPYMLAKVLWNEYYLDLRELAMALAGILAGQLRGIDAAVLQVDEPNLPGSPEDGDLAAEAINTVLEAVSGEKAVHLCFGNYGGQTIQKGDYSRLVRFMNALRCDHLVLETTRRAPEDLARLTEVRTEVRLGIGVIDVKDLQVESPDLVARRIESMARLLGPDRLAYVHPDCGLRLLPRTVADAKMQALAAGRDLYLGPGARS